MEATESNPVAAKRFALPPWLTLVLRLAATAGLMAYALSGIDWHDKVVDGRVQEGVVHLVAERFWAPQGLQVPAQPVSYDFR